MALINGTNAHPLAATAGIVGGIVAMPFVTAGVAVTGALVTVGVSIPTLGLGAVPGALLTTGATVGSVFVSPFAVGSKIYNKCVPAEDEISFVGPLLEEAIEEVPKEFMHKVFNTSDFKEVVDI